MDLEALQPFIDLNMVMSSRHWKYPISIFNYTQNTQFNKLWNEYTLQCRGLVIEDSGKVVARPFKKFFNYEELDKNVIPWGEVPMITEKADGSLGIIFYYDNQWQICTRGSFASDQAIKGAEILKKYNTHLFKKEYTYLAEIIYPENRIVLDYGMDEKLIFISAIHNETGIEMDPSLAYLEWKDLGLSEEDIIPSVKTNGSFTPETFQLLKDNYKENMEGYVVRMYPSDFRFKIKFEDYVALHRIVTHFNEKALLKILAAGDKIPEGLPDEFYRQMMDKLQPVYDAIYIIIDKAIWQMVEDRLLPYASRKDQALWLHNNLEKRYQGIMFAMLDGKDWKNMIWKLVK